MTKRVPADIGPLFILGCSLAALLILLTWPELAWWPILLAVLPWLFNLLAGGSLPIRRTAYDWLILLFLFTALIAIGSAFDQAAALVKFRAMLLASLLYLALAAQKEHRRWWLIGLIAVSGGYLALNSLLTTGQPAVMGHISNAAESTIFFGPLAAVGAIQFWQSGRKVKALLFGALTLLLLQVSLTTASGGVWLALLMGAVTWLLWAAAHRQRRVEAIRPDTVFVLALGVLIALAVLAMVLAPAYVMGLERFLPGQPRLGSRLGLLFAAFDLAREFPILGGGLDSFAGLYSQYILVIPHFRAANSLNIWLNLAIEQGIPGVLAMGALLVWLGWLLLIAQRNRRAAGNQQTMVNGAVMASLAIYLVQSLVDIVFSDGGLLPLLMLAGLTVVNLDIRREPGRPGRRFYATLGLSLLVALVFLGLNRDQLLATWYANWGAVQMAKVELAGWPTNAWADGSEVNRLVGAEHAFESALRHDPEQLTAHYRLGLIALARRDFPLAVAHFEIAHRQDIVHRGIRKNLGYAYVWAGESDAALGLLNSLPEAAAEMDVYIWWWGTQNRVDLSSRAAKLEEQLHE